MLFSNERDRFLCSFPVGPFCLLKTVIDEVRSVWVFCQNGVVVGVVAFDSLLGTEGRVFGITPRGYGIIPLHFHPVDPSVLKVGLPARTGSWMESSTVDLKVGVGRYCSS